MDTQRFILIVSLSLVIMLLWDAWQRDYGQQQQLQQQQSEKQEEVKAADLPELPEEQNEIAVESKTGVSRESDIITVSTDLLTVEINTRGGTIQKALLLEYPEDKAKPETPVSLLNSNGDVMYIIQGGLLSNGEAPTHDTLYRAEKKTYELDENEDVIRVPLAWSNDKGLQVTKVFEFYRNKYLIDLQYEIQNNATETWKGRAYGQIQRTNQDEGGNGLIYTYTGAVLSSPENRYEKISFDDISDKNINRDVVNGWAAMIKHYFVTAIIPGSTEVPYHYYSLYIDKNTTRKSLDSYVVGATSEQISLAGNSSGEIEHQLYIGPKLQHRLENIADGLELTVDYGKLWFIAKPLFWCLEKFHGLTGNWGWAIILVTLMLKVLFYNLSAAGYRSMARMRKVQPRMMALRDRYKNDRAKLNKAMMDLYKEEKINPLGGCFPILIQIPVFIALYWVLLESVELRQAGFILWIDDLSAQDPYFILPLVMGVTMFIQQKLNPAPMDPVQEKIMMTLPFVFTIFFAFFPSGLVLYWVVNNILSIAQQWLITRNMERSGISTGP